MVEVVVEDLVAALSVLHGEVVAGADEEEVPHHLTDHPLVQEPVVNVLPVCVLQDKASSNILYILPRPFVPGLERMKI
jgi:hypothetical protein